MDEEITDQEYIDDTGVKSIPSIQSIATVLAINGLYR